MGAVPGQTFHPTDLTARLALTQRYVQAISKNCKGPHGLGEYIDVTVPRKSDTSIKGTDFITDTQHSFVFAEVLKYAYLLMDPDHEISLDDYVFNTEAHPLRISE